MILNIFLAMYIATILFVLIKNILAILKSIKNNDTGLSDEIIKLKSLFPERISLIVVCIIISVVLVVGSICWPLVIWWNMKYDGDHHE